MEEYQDEEEVVDVADCGRCGHLTEHEVLRRVPKGEGEDVRVRCVDCNKVQTLYLRPGKPITVNAILSDGPESFKTRIDADDDELIRLDDVFEFDEILYRVTRLDDSDSRPAQRRTASEIGTLWAVRCDRAIVRLTMTDGDESFSKTIECLPDELFACGNIMEVEGERWRIRAIHTGKGRTLRGKRAAIDIRRIYLHTPHAPRRYREESYRGPQN